MNGITLSNKVAKNSHSRISQSFLFLLDRSRGRPCYSRGLFSHGQRARAWILGPARGCPRASGELEGLCGPCHWGFLWKGPSQHTRLAWARPSGVSYQAYVFKVLHVPLSGGKTGYFTETGRFLLCLSVSFASSLSLPTTHHSCVRQNLPANLSV